MRLSREEKERSHERIISSAAKLFRRDGIEGASVGDVMQDAGLTHGGFYKHFDTKEALLIAALDRAFEETLAWLGPKQPDEEPAATAGNFRKTYLSNEHVDAPSMGCPIAALGIDIARGTKQMKARFGMGVRRVVSLLARGSTGTQRMREARALRQIAMMAGAVIIARASDPDTAREVMAACRDRSASN
ncbi:MAG: TetR/AcrR family transcriptional regulator [Acetobacteraceae bacterium]|nr:TetR/AcrR family transcriptional regulator [Acetobacteraceae bacterium]